MTLDETATVRWQNFAFDDANEFAPSLHNAAFVLFHKPNGFDHVGEQQCPRDPFGTIQRVGAIVFDHCRTIVRKRCPFLGTALPLARPVRFDCVVHERSPQPRLVLILPQASLTAASSILHQASALMCELPHI
jgi:hypothetical protein